MLNDGEKALSVLYSDPFCGRQQGKSQEVVAGDAVERGEQCSVGVCLLVAQAQRVSALACTQPLALVISYLTAHREECGAVPVPQKGSASPHGHVGSGLSQHRGSAQGYWEQRQPRAGLPLFSFSTGESWCRSRDLSCCGLSVSPPRINMTRCLQHPSCLSDSPRNRHGSWLSQPTGLPDRAVSPCFMLLLYLSPLF